MVDLERFVSVVTPVYNEEENIKPLYSLFCEITHKLAQNYTFELIFVNDGSSDKSSIVIEDVAKADNRIKYIELSRNFGKEIAVTAGLNNCFGDAAIIIDADLQHPVELIPEFINKWEAGAEVVVGVRKSNRGEGIVKKVGSLLFYKIINQISDVKIVPQATDFRLIDRVVINEFNKFVEARRMTRALIDWLGFKRDYVYFDANERNHGKAGYGFLKLFRLAMDSFVSLSLFPLKLSGYLGFIISLFSGFLGLYILLGKYFFHESFASSFSGPAQLAILIVFLVGIILMSLGLIALYVANIHGEVVGRPIYVVRKKYDQV